MLKKSVSVMLWMAMVMAAGAQLSPTNSSGRSGSDCVLDPTAPGCSSVGQSQTNPLSGNPNDASQSQGANGQAGTSPLSRTPSIDVGSTDLGTVNEQLPAGTAAQSAAALAQKPPRPPELENEFQSFVEISTGQRLPLFGAGLFLNTPTTFADASRIPITGNYIVGPGDELVISIWGPISLNARVIVDREGNVELPRVGPINVAGVHYEQLHDRLQEGISHYYKNFQLSVTIGRLRSIQVYVTGFARRPGSYTISSLSSLVNALFTSGGPSAQGSMRHIQLKREGKVVTEFDLYDFLLRGDSSKDVGLQPEDVIFIPAVGPLIAVSGAVHVPAIYELSNESTLREAIDDAGGLSTVADTARVIVERIDKHTTRSVTEVPYTDEATRLPLHDGDIVRIASLSPKMENAVILRGNVALPGRYPYRPGMRIRDLIPTRESLLTPEFWKAQVAVRERDPYALPSTYGTGNYAPYSTQNGTQVYGPQTTGQAGTQPGMSTDANGRVTPRTNLPSGLEEHIAQTTPGEEKNSIRLSAPEINWDYAVIQRMNPVDLTTHLVPFNLGKALSGDDANNVTLEPGDILTIFSQRDIAVPRDRRTRFVTIEGEINAPGVYRIEPGDTLRSVLLRAGNITPKAYLYGTLLTRESAREQQQALLGETTDQLSAENQQRAASDTAGHPEDAATISMRSAAQEQMLLRMRNVKASGRLVLEVRPTDDSVDDLPDIPLEDGDRVNIPQKINMVSVIGAVYRQSSYIYLEGKSVRHYLRLAGSATQTADLKHALLVRADGSVVSRKTVSGLWKGGFYDVRVLPGDSLVIPTKLATGAFQRNLRDWSQIASQFAIAGASLAVISGL